MIEGEEKENQQKEETRKNRIEALSILHDQGRRRMRTPRSLYVQW